MIKNRNNGPLFIAPRDEYGNKKIWNEDKQEYVVNEALYAIPLKFAPRDANGQKMEWNTDRLVYESKTTGQVFSTILMDFVDQKNNRDAVDFMEDAALDNNIIDEDEFDKMIDSYQDYYEDEAIDVAEEFLDDDYVSIYDDDYVSEEEIEFYDEEERIRQQQEEEQQMAYAAMVFAVDPNEFG